jgi:hypothetical protein
MPVGRYDGGVPRPVEEVLDDVDGLLDELAGVVGAEALDGHRAGAGGLVSAGPVAVSRLVAASARLRVAGARMDAVRWSVLPRIEAEGSWAVTGARSFAVWLARVEDVQTLTARRDVRTARALRDHLPATLTKALAGNIGVDKVRALVEVATTSTPRTDALAAPAIDQPTTGPAPTQSAPTAPTAPTARLARTPTPARPVTRALARLVTRAAARAAARVTGPRPTTHPTRVAGLVRRRGRSSCWTGRPRTARTGSGDWFATSPGTPTPTPTNAATPRPRTANTWTCPPPWAGTTCPGS